MKYLRTTVDQLGGSQDWIPLSFFKSPLDMPPPYLKRATPVASGSSLAPKKAEQADLMIKVLQEIVSEPWGVVSFFTP